MSNLADLNDIDSRLKEVSQHSKIEHIDLYGGEIGLLPTDYLNSLHETISKYYDGKVNVITNLSKVNPYFLRDDVELSVSYDFQARQGHVGVWNNMLILPKEISVLILASEEVLTMNVDTMICALNLRNVKSVEIKPYSSNQANQQNIAYNKFEEFIKKWLRSSVDKEFVFVNEDNIIGCLDRNRNSFSDDHIYITPNGRFGVLDFDEQDNEIFTELDSVSQYLEWTQKEKEIVENNIYCGNCKFLGNCLTEHYRDVKSINKSCNGFKHLLEWYDERYND